MEASPSIYGSGGDAGGVQIRMASPADAALIASVLRESFVEYEALYTPEGFAATAAASDEVLRRMTEGPSWVALLEGPVVGTVSAITREEDLYIRGMAVLPAVRGRGVGKLLLEQIETYARAQSRKRLILSTTPFLQHAIRLYEHFGFRRSEEGPRELFGTPLLTMLKKIA